MTAELSAPDFYLFRAFVTAAIAIIALYVLRTWLAVRALRQEIAVAHRLLVVWAQTWGQPDDTVREALQDAVRALAAGAR